MEAWCCLNLGSCDYLIRGLHYNPNKLIYMNIFLISLDGAKITKTGKCLMRCGQGNFIPKVIHSFC